jgi:hypothetical protein
MDLFEKHIDKAKEMMQGAINDSKAGKELQAGIAALEALPTFEGSMLYTMEFETIMTYLRTLGLVVEDGRMDDASVKEEVRIVIEKVQPASAVAEDDAEQQAIEKAKAVAFDTCLRVLDALETSK